MFEFCYKSVTACRIVPVRGRSFFLGHSGEVLMTTEPNYELMADVDRRFRGSSGLTSRADYSIFYGPLRPSRLLMINANPGGSPDNYRIVDLAAGEHEYIEGRHSGPTTRNGAEILMHIAGSSDSESIRGVQVLNRYFRRSPTVQTKLQRAHMAEARPFLAELIQYIRPQALLFGGDSGAAIFARAHGANLQGGPALKGPNGTNEATYFRKYEMSLPYYRRIPAYGIYHPSKMNSFFRKKVFPKLREELGPLFEA